MKLKIIVEQAEEGGYWARVPGLPGCYSQGETLAELEENIKDAVEGWLAVAAEQAVAAGGQLQEIEA